MKWFVGKKLKATSRPSISRQSSDEARVVYVSDQTQIAQLKTRMKRILSLEVQVGQLSAHVLPVLQHDQQVIVFMTVDFSASDVAELIVQQLHQCGYELASVWQYVVPLTLLLEISRDQALQPKAKVTEGGAQERWTQADLYTAFLDIVRWALQHKASDIHISIFSHQAYSEVCFSILGRYIRPKRYQGLRTTFLLDMLAVAWMYIRGGNGAVFDPHKEQQGSLLCDIDNEEVRLRWGALAAEAGPSICLRILSYGRAELPPLSTLGYLPHQQHQLEQAALDMQGGAIVFSGAVGSGKTTALAALLSLLPDWRKLISLEDPVEYSIPSAIQIALTRNLDQDAHDQFATKLRAIKRAAMSDVLLGEIRDIETGRAFTDLSSSGVRLYTTVHAGSAALIPTRLSSDFIGVSRQLLASGSILRLLVHQCLLPRLCDNCSVCLDDLTTYPPVRHGQNYEFEAWRVRLSFLLGQNKTSAVRVRNQQGCHLCRQVDLPALAGWTGRTVCAEIIDPMQQDIDSLALASSADLELRLQQQGWRDIRHTALCLVACGWVDPFDVELFFASLFDSRWQPIGDL